MRIGVLGVCALGLLTAACGTNETQRAATGGLTGVGVGALAGGPIGAVVGGVVGAGAGSMMPEGADQIANNVVGKERRVAQGGLRDAGIASGPSGGAVAQNRSVNAGSGSSMRHEGSDPQVRQAQQELKAEGLYHGRVDGVFGPQTRDAVASYQQQHNLQQTATLDQATLNALNNDQSGNRQTARTGNSTASSGSSTAPMMSADEVRSRLQSDGFDNVTDLRQVNDTTYTAHAVKGGTTYALQVDGQSGRVLSQQQASAGDANAPGGQADTGTAGAGSSSSGTSR
jgi:peptidoglycan hydrolase-like protein with peptidoglycan-binding domain